MTDFYNIDDLLNEEQKIARDATNAFITKDVKPIIEEFAQKSEAPQHLIQKFGEMGLFGPAIPTEYGGGGMDDIAYGLIMQEVERGDSGLRSMASVQSSLVMYPIYTFGSDEQRKKYLPKLASGEYLGCFGLTEPNHGSNPSGMETHLIDKGDYYLLNGAKMWITNSPIADIAVVWARDENKRVKGVIVEKGMAGFTAPEIHNKWSLRASITGELVFDNVKIPKENVLPKKDGLGAPLMCLDSARYGIAWGAIGAAIDCYETARDYSLERKQFDKPIGGFQLTQKKLSEMLTEITKAQLLALRLGQLKVNGKATSTQISMAKRNNVEMALKVAREARQILGGMGISGEYPIMRHMMNLESVITYEGTHDIHLLILGADITGIPAFK
ncbi:acyl-CoA dehydrogenase family protein [Flammeovirga kamogawensis]|uniref:glutaryl-CoA dehydrogenase (ETF) n=1 Tax=Flammeovirga kamogawensis TaxID=373891 RepID=A0ABX8GWP4_9BACT|nr:acyl-CoA dehydrogenase family protein [Flammeovirga kamogawensis]MBB6461182.1 glutaryl-CoA dehydrogenase [Flammeovirga kamogawensis]QWG07746.1 acyl-CoA dehydrogenase family protein [Flammeovirga kamogawensis]TRX69552.1 acyl-CoA dehydrogenase [Flammeovirga kamogawensis]